MFYYQAQVLSSELQDLHLADSITIDPHKLLFAPFNAGALVLRDRKHQLSTFGEEGEYLEGSISHGIDFAEHGIQLGRGMADEFFNAQTIKESLLQ